MVRKILINLLSSGLIFIAMSGCMHTGTGMMDHPKGMMNVELPSDQEADIQTHLDQMIAEIMTDLSAQSLEITTIAVLDIKSPDGLPDGDVVRQKLISELVTINQFRVVSRERIGELFREQGLSQSGSIDKDFIVETGQLIGVDGFLDGYITIIDEKQLSLGLNLIETDSGEIIWSKSVNRIFR